MTPEQQAAMRQALAFIRWNCFGECRTEGWDGPPPTAADTETALLQCLEQQPAIPAPPEAQTEAEQRAYAFGWWKAMETVREQQPADEPFGWYDMEHGEIRDVEWTRQKPIYEGNWKPLYTRPQPAAPAIPEGWKLVPVEPTTEMLEAFKHRYKEGDFWRERIHGAVAAMLAAAPEKKGN